MRAVLIGSLALVAAACAEPRDLFVVVVDSDLTSAELPCVELVALAVDAEDASEVTHSVVMSETPGMEDLGLASFPFSFGVLEPRGPAPQRAVLAVRGYGPGPSPCFNGGSDPRIERRVRLRFGDGDILGTTVALAPECEGVGCGPEQTCVCDGCVDPACASIDEFETSIIAEPGDELTEVTP